MGIHRGSGNEQFKALSGLATDSGDNVYAVDHYNGNVQKFTSDGTYLKQWGIFDRPNAVAVDSAGNVYVADYGYHISGFDRIQKIALDGTLTQFTNANGDSIAIDNASNIYITDSTKNDLGQPDGDNPHVQKFSSDGAFLTDWGSNGTLTDSFTYQLILHWIPLAMSMSLIAVIPASRNSHSANQPTRYFSFHRSWENPWLKEVSIPSNGYIRETLDQMSRSNCSTEVF